MRLSTSAFIVGLAILGLPLSSFADCTVFSADGPACAAAKPKLQVDLAKLVADKVQAEKMLERVRQAMASQSVPTDCKMIKPVDPQFVSKMPVQTPDPDLKLPIKTVAVPSCEK
jgi:hypothetical protein